MKNALFVFAALLFFCLQSCHRPVGYFQRTPHVAARLPVERVDDASTVSQPDSLFSVDTSNLSAANATEPVALASAGISSTPKTMPSERIVRRMQHIERVLSTPVQATDKQPRPKPKKQLRLGNRIRESLGIPLRKELNWWQRISWKLKASVIVILVAVVFAILNLTLLAVIFGLLGAFLMITGLKRSFKVRRPWF